MKEFIQAAAIGFTGAAIIAALIAAFILLTTVVIYPFGKAVCNNYGRTTGQATRYNALGAECYVKTSTGWFEKGQIKSNKVEVQ